MTDGSEMQTRFFDPLGLEAMGGPVRGRQDTSRQAACEGVARVTRDRRRVLAYVVSTGEQGATQDQCSAGILMEPQTVSARFWELRTAGFIVRTPHRRLRWSGATAAVHRATEQGLTALHRSLEAATRTEPTEGAA